MLAKVKQYSQEISGFLHKVCEQFDTEEKDEQDLSKEEQLIWEIHKTKQDIQNAQAYFDSVTDPGLIDHASYLLEAHERRLRYLLSQAREYKIKTDYLMKE